MFHIAKMIGGKLRGGKHASHGSDIVTCELGVCN